MLQIDEVVVGTGITGNGVGRSGVAGGRIGWRDCLRLDGRRPAERRVVQDRQIFRDCATGSRIEVFGLGDASPSMRVRHDNAGVDCESLASHDPFFHTARHDGLEELTQKIALTKPAVAVLGEGRMIGNVAVEPQPTKPAVSKIDVDLIAQPTLRTNAGAVADNQHAHHQLGIDRGPPDVAIVRPQVRPQLA